jgi:hypothetical protein
MANEMKRVGRKLLIASLGVASVGFGACGGSSSSSADAAVADAGSESSDAATDAQGGPADAADVSPDRYFVGNII